MDNDLRSEAAALRQMLAALEQRIADAEAPTAENTVVAVFEKAFPTAVSRSEVIEKSGLKEGDVDNALQALTAHQRLFRVGRGLYILNSAPAREGSQGSKRRRWKKRPADVTDAERKAVVDAIASYGKPFRASDIEAICGVDAGRVAKRFHGMVEAGFLRRIDKGLYAVAALRQVEAG